MNKKNEKKQVETKGTNDVFPQSRREPKTRLELVTYSLRMNCSTN